MAKGIHQTLRTWRAEQARIEGVETYRVLPNAVLDALAGSLPRTKEEMLCVKGIKEAKFQKYGSRLLNIIAEYTSSRNASDDGSLGVDFGRANDEEDEAFEKGDSASRQNQETEPLSVSQFLDGLNVELSGMAARVRGEVSSVDERERVVYFTLKDSEDESMVNCLIFRYQYEISGVKIAVGDEIIVEGCPEIYKPNGRLSLKVGIIELFGEGALKKAYDALKLKLEQEGLFATERKRMLPKFPERIALITSEQGAAIGDFTMNLGSQGFKVDFYPTSVEGKKAVLEIIQALRYFNSRAENYDVLVMVRGGGSLESLQAFNNEALVREVAAMKMPTLLGIGHEKDVTLAALVADVMVSTPTATARTLREPFEHARQSVRHAETLLTERFARELTQTKHFLSQSEDVLSSLFPKIKERFMHMEQKLLRSFERIRYALRQSAEFLVEAERKIGIGFHSLRDRFKQKLERAQEKLREYDPNRALKLGYSLVKAGKKLVRSVDDVKQGDTLDIQVQDGTIGTEVKRIAKL